MFPAVINFRNRYWPTSSKSPILFVLRRNCRDELSLGIQALIVIVIVSGAVKCVCSRFRGVFHEAPAGAAILSREVAVNNLHLLDRVVGNGALLRVVMIDCAAEGSAIQVVLHGHGLSAIHAGHELAAAKYGISIGAHGDISRLNVEQRLRQTDIGAHDCGKIVIILPAKDA